MIVTPLGADTVIMLAMLAVMAIQVVCSRRK